jgi:hypothetical protein
MNEHKHLLAIDVDYSLNVVHIRDKNILSDHYEFDNCFSFTYCPECGEKINNE